MISAPAPFWAIATLTLLGSFGGACSSESSAVDPAPNVPSIAASELAADSNEKTPADEDILVRLQKVPGVVSVTEGSSPFPGTRFFVLLFEQPADHRKPEGHKFTQRFTLLFRSLEMPMVLESTGYDIPVTPPRRQPELVRLLQANTIRLEHLGRRSSSTWRVPLFPERPA